MNQKSIPTTTSQIAVVHLGNNAKPSATSNGKTTNGTIVFSSTKNVTRAAAPGVPPKPTLIHQFRNTNNNNNKSSGSVSLPSSDLKVNPAKLSDQSDKSLTDDSAGSPVPPDARAKQVLKEAVNAVVNSFAKHSQGGGYGRGKFMG